MIPIANLSLPGATGMAETVPAGPAVSNAFTTLLSALQPGGSENASIDPAAVTPEIAASVGESGSALETAYVIDLAAKDVASRLPPVVSDKTQAPKSSDTTEADRPVFPGAQAEAPAGSQESSDGASSERGDPRKQDTDRNFDEPFVPAPIGAWTPVVLPIVATSNALPAEAAAEEPNATVTPTAGRGTDSTLLGLLNPHGTKQAVRHMQLPAAGSAQEKQSDIVSLVGSKDTSDTLAALEDLARLPEQSGITAHASTERSHARSQIQSPLSASPPPGLAEGDLSQLDALVRDIAELSGSSGRAAFRVSGRELGDVHVQLRTTDAGLSVNIRTQSEHGHSAVAQAQGQLADDMRANGLKVAATSVAVGHEGAERNGGERHPVPRHVPVETAPAPELEQPQNEQRRDGRYA
jgi:Flagellar hook-length control protein FliK